MESPVSSALISRLRSIRNKPKKEQECCNFCGISLPSAHRHMINPVTRQFMCACETCMITQAIHGEYKIIPQRYIWLRNFNLPEAVWSEFLIPVNMAFFVHSSVHQGIVAYYPAAAGATESRLKMEAWKKLQELNPVVDDMKPDLEALLINRTNDDAEFFIVPIDCCYELIGTIRTNWKGIYGGKEVTNATRIFFDALKNKANHAGTGF